MLVLVLLVALPLSWNLHVVRKRSDLLRWCRASGGAYDAVGDQGLVNGKRWIVASDDPSISLLRRWMGDHEVIFMVFPPKATPENRQQLAKWFPEASPFLDHNDMPGRFHDGRVDYRD